MSYAFFSFRYAQSRALFLAFVACLYLGLHGQMPKSSAGWVLPLPAPLEVTLMRRPTTGYQRRRSRRRRQLNQYRDACLASAIHFIQQNSQPTLLKCLFLALVFYSLAEAFLILSMTPLLLLLIKTLSRLRPELDQQPEWRMLVWLLSWFESMLILVSATFVFFQVYLAHGSQNQFSSFDQTYPLLLLLNQTKETDHTSNPRLEMAQKMAALQAARDLNPEASRRQLAMTLGIPESTLRHWEQRQKQIEAPEEVVAFFESPEGVLFLHRLVLAAQFTMGFVTPIGVRNLCQFLELSGLSAFVASSYGSQRKMILGIEKAIVDFGQEEEKRLVAQMPQKEVTLAEDETFKPALCLVAIEPVSDFILAETYSSDRTA